MDLPERQERLKELFARLRDLPPEQREAELNAASEDAGLLAEVRSLLSQHDRFTAITPPPTGLHTVSTLAAGQVLGPYRIVAAIGGGGFGMVYHAEHLKMKRRVALKVLNPELARSRRALARFQREIELVAQLDHPNVVRAFDAGECDGWHYLVMEYLEGTDLHALVRQRGPLPIPEACELVRQAALALRYVHERGLVHRDVKPSNLWRMPDGQVRLLDLGLARLGPPDATERTVTHGVLGTPDYIAPEQVEDTHGAGPAADLYALGATLYTLLTGAPPFADVPADQVLRKLRAVAERIVPPIRTMRPDVPVGLEALLARLLAKSPAERPGTAAEVAEALLPFSVGDDDPAPGPAPAAASPAAVVAPLPRRLQPARGALAPDSPFYVTRTADAELLAALSRCDSIVRVRGPRQVGKTSLLARGVQQCERDGLRVAVTDLQSLNESDFASADAFYLAVGTWMAQSLDLPQAPADIWNDRYAPNLNFERFVSNTVLKTIGAPLVWVLDEVDRLFNRAFAGDVFSLLRSWHNQRSHSRRTPFCRLTIAIGYATEADLFIADVNQSPFNVGTSIALEDFTAEQLADLNRRYGSPLPDQSALDRYVRLVGGHPYLGHYGLYWLAAHGADLAALEEQACRDQGPFGEHLRRIRVLLGRAPELAEGLCELLRGNAKLSADGFSRLRSAGILTGESPREARWRCPLYATYLERHLP